MKKEYWMVDPEVAFERAIAYGRLSLDPNAANYAGHYMYMNTQLEGDMFKHRESRGYLGGGCIKYPGKNGLDGEAYTGRG